MRIMSDKAITKEEVEQAIADLQMSHKKSEQKLFAVALAGIALSSLSLLGTIILFIR